MYETKNELQRKSMGKEKVDLAVDISLNSVQIFSHLVKYEFRIQSINVTQKVLKGPISTGPGLSFSGGSSCIILRRDHLLTASYKDSL